MAYLVIKPTSATRRDGALSSVTKQLTRINVESHRKERLGERGGEKDEERQKKERELERGSKRDSRVQRKRERNGKRQREKERRRRAGSIRVNAESMGFK